MFKSIKMAGMLLMSIGITSINAALVHGMQRGLSANAARLWSAVHQQRLMSVAPSWWDNPFTYNSRKALYDEKIRKGMQEDRLAKFLFGLESAETLSAVGLNPFREVLEAPGLLNNIEKAIENNPDITPEVVASLFSTPVRVFNLLSVGRGLDLVDRLSTKNPEIINGLMRTLKAGIMSDVNGYQGLGQLVKTIVIYNGKNFARLFKRNSQIADDVAEGIAMSIASTFSNEVPSWSFMHSLVHNNTEILPLIAAKLTACNIDYLMSRYPKKSHYILTSLLAHPEAKAELACKVDILALEERVRDIYHATAPSADDLACFSDKAGFFSDTNPYLVLSHIPKNGVFSFGPHMMEPVYEEVSAASSPEDINEAYDLLTYEFNPKRFDDASTKQTAATILENLQIARDGALQGKPVDEALMQRLVDSR